MKKNVNIEALRIFACLMVIALHASSDVRKFPTECDILVRVFTKSAVGIFLMIMGYFLFVSTKSYWQKLKHVFTDIYVPMLIVILLSSILEPMVADEQSLAYCISHIHFDWKVIFTDLLREQTKAPLCGHLWYVYAYIRIIVWLPLIGLMCVNKPHENRIRRGYMILQFWVLLAADIQYGVDAVVHLPVIWRPFSPIDSKLLYVLLGYEMCLIFQKRPQRQKPLLAFLLFVGMCEVLYSLTVFCREYNIETSNYLSISAVPVIISGICIFYFFMCLNIPMCLHRGIYFIADKTFYIYLIHYAVSRKITRTDVIDKWLGSQNYLGLFWFDFVVSFVISLLIASVIKEVEKRIFKKKHC